MDHPQSPILIIEDNADVRDVLETLLRREGYAVASAANGLDALEQLRSGIHPCLMLLDYQMPVMDGRTFREQQLSDGLDTDVPVILYSADHTMMADDLRVELVLRKPMDLDEVLRAIAWFCTGHRTPFV